MNKKVLESQFGTAYNMFYDLIGDVYPDSEIPLEEYRRMIDRDETVASSLEFLTFNAANRIGTYVHDNKNIQTFVRKNLDNIEGSFENFVTEFMKNALAFGFGVAEIVWEVNGDKYYVKKLVILPPESISFVVENNDIIAIKQITSKGTVEIPREKIVLFRLGNGIAGQSTLRRAWRTYMFKSGLFKFWAIAMERYSMPILHGKTTDVDTLLEELRNLWLNGIIATDTNTEIELLEPRNNIAGEFKNAIEFANVLIARALLIPPLLITNERTGAYSLGKVQMTLFQSAVERLAKLTSEALLDELITKIISYNFNDIGEVGEFIISSKPTPEDLSRLAIAFNQLVGAGVIDPEDDAEWLYSMLGMRKKNKEDTENEAQFIEMIKNSIDLGE